MNAMAEGNFGCQDAGCYAILVFLLLFVIMASKHQYNMGATLLKVRAAQQASDLATGSSEPESEPEPEGEGEEGAAPQGDAAAPAYERAMAHASKVLTITTMVNTLVDEMGKDQTPEGKKKLQAQKNACATQDGNV